MKQLTFFFFYFFFILNAAAATITFDNSGGNLRWGDPTNWDLNRVPKPEDDVIINPGFTVVVIPSNTTAQAKSITLNEGMLNIFGLLVVDGGVDGIIGTGTASAIYVEGILVVQNINGGNAIQLEGDLNVVTSGQLIVDKVSSGDIPALTCFAGLNQGTIEVKNSSSGMRINGDFTNQGEIELHDLTHIGLFIRRAGGGNAATLINEGELTIYAIDRTGIEVADSLINDGQIDIFDVDSLGILTSNISHTINNGTFDINNSLRQSAYLYGEFINYGTLNINQDQIEIEDQEMISLRNNGLIDNHSIVNITNTGAQWPKGLLSIGESIINRPNGKMTLDNMEFEILDNIHTGHFSNQGYLITNGTQINVPNGIPLFNIGVIISTSDDDALPPYNNSSGVICHLQQANKFEVGVSALDVFIGNDLLQFTDELFVDEALTISAGSLFNNNVWIPSSNAAGHNSFYAEFDNGVISKDTLLITFESTVKSGENIWTNNAGNKIWSDPNNWSLNHPPTASEFVLINNPTDVVSIGSATNAESLDLVCHGKLMIEVGGELIITGTHYNAIHIETTGELEIRGTLNIDSPSDDVALLVDGIATNDGTINCEDCNIGLSVENTFTNNGSIRLNDGDHGIKLSGSTSVFNNSGLIALKNMNIEIRGGSTFNNYSNGVIDINKGTDYFISFQGGTSVLGNTFNNYGTLTARRSEWYGILGGWFTFNNYESGTVTLKEVVRSNLMLGGSSNAAGTSVFLGPGIFNNYGHLDISESGELFDNINYNITSLYGGIHMRTSGEFYNWECGTVLIDDVIEYETLTATFQNDGIVHSTTADLNLTVPGIINNSIILDDLGAWQGTAFANNGFLIEPITQPVFVGQNVSNLFNVAGGTTDMNPQFYADEQLTQFVGTYDVNNNSWVPNPNATGISKVYFEMDYGSCTDIDFFELSLPVVNPCRSFIWMGQNGDWDDTANWNLNALPQPCDTIIIGGTATVTIPATFSAFASIIKLNKGNLVIEAGGSLTLNSTYGLAIEGENNSSITNHGNMTINDAIAGIQLKDATCSLFNDGSIAITTTGTGIGLVDQADAVNDNGGSINITGGAFGITIPSDGSVFLNNGVITINNATKGISLDDFGSFNNPGTVNINNAIATGVEVKNEALFTNAGELLITNTTIGNAIEIASDAGVSNSNGGAEIIILATGSNGIRIHPSAYLSNSGILEIRTNIGAAGIFNSGTLFNNETGQLEISDYTTYGLWQNNANTKLFNKGFTTINPAGLEQIRSEDGTEIQVLSGQVWAK